MFLGLFVLLIVGIISSSGGSKDSSTTPAGGGTASSAPSGVTSAPSDAARNVTVTDCKVDDLGGTRFVSIGFTVNNPTSKSSTCLIAVDVADSTGARVSETSGIQPNVIPGRPAEPGQAAGNVSTSAVAPFTCTVGKVTRTAAN